MIKLKSYLKSAWAFIRKWWWAVLLGLAAMTGAILKLLMKPKSDGAHIPKEGVTGSLKSMAKDEVDKAKTDLLIQKARRDTRIEVKEEEIRDIERDPDPVRRRRRTSDLFNEGI